MQSSRETFQLSAEAAEAYEARFVPALFAQWAPRLVELAGIAPGQAVLDVACGTGIVARTAADLIGDRGRIVGLDLNDAMLGVARRIRPDIEWRQGDVARLPFADGSFDAALCQMALMFFPDRVGALREMGRVVKPGGTVALVVPGHLRSQPAYAPFVEMAARHAGSDAVSLLSTYFVCGDPGDLRTLLESAGLRAVDVRTHLGTARFGSVDEFVAAEVQSTPLMERISPDVYERIRAGAHEALRPFTKPTGAVHVPLQGHVAAARTRA
jgi:ubiquinone/menaquinone biosynthesis C-methylase UbiE